MKKKILVVIGIISSTLVMGHYAGQSVIGILLGLSICFFTAVLYSAKEE